MRAIWNRGLILVLTFSLAACGDSTVDDAATQPGPRPGTLAVVVASPFDNDGAMSFDLRGEAISSVRAADAETFLVTSPTGVRVAVVGHSVEGEVVRFDVPDVGALDSYAATLLDVVDDRNDVRRDISAYRLEIQEVR